MSLHEVLVERCLYIRTLQPAEQRVAAVTLRCALRAAALFRKLVFDGWLGVGAFFDHKMSLISGCTRRPQWPG